MKMYKKPITEVNVVETDYLLTETVSFGSGGGSTPPPVHAPKSGDIID